MKFAKYTAVLAVSALLVGCNTSLVSREANTDEPLFMQLTEDDVRLANLTVQAGLETAFSGTTMRWRNTSSGNSGGVTPTSTYKLQTGSFCRIYDETVTIGTTTGLYEFIACRGKEGVWQPVDLGSDRFNLRARPS